jgi:ParB family chromosome partitioning protein
MRRLDGHAVDLTEEEIAARNAREAELDGLEQQYAEVEEVPEQVDRRLGEIETALEALDDRPIVYDPAEIAFAGAFVSIDRDWSLRIERGHVRPEDEPPVEPVQAKDHEAPSDGEPGGPTDRGVITVGAGGTPEREAEAEEHDGLKPLSERLITELTAHRTVALRDALANDSDTAVTAVLHALCLSAFYRFSSGSCLEISAKSASFGTQAPGLADSASAKAIEVRHQQWAKQLPKGEDDLWDALVGFDADSRATLFAHCASLSVNAVHEPWSRNPRRLAHADTLARMEVGMEPVLPTHGEPANQRRVSRCCSGPAGKRLECSVSLFVPGGELEPK